MKMLRIIFFEMTNHLRSLPTWLYYAGVLLLLLMVADEFTDYAQTIGGILMNAPMVIADFTGFASKFGLLLIAALCGAGAMRDINARMEPLVYTSSISKFQYLGSKFLGIFITAALLLTIAVPLCLFIASHAYGVHDSLYGPFNLQAYLIPILLITLPNVFFSCMVAFGFTILFRNSMAAFAGMIILFLISTLSIDLVNREAGQLLDPLGIHIIVAQQTKLTPLTQNTALLSLTRSLLHNRLIWLLLSLLAGYFMIRRFSFSELKPWFTLRPKRKKIQEHHAGHSSNRVHHLPEAVKNYDFGGKAYQVYHLILSYYRDMIRGYKIIILPVIILLVLIILAFMNKGPLDYPILPVTERLTILMKNLPVDIMIVMTILFYAGYLMNREQDTMLNEISDAIPVSNGVMLIGKTGAMILMVITLKIAVILSAVLLQLLKGFRTIHIGEYLAEILFYQLADHLLIAGVAIGVHAILFHKYIAQLILVLFYSYMILPHSVGIEHKLLIFGSEPEFTDSVFYNKSVYLPYWILLKSYWFVLVLLLLVITCQTWVRGRETGWRQRVKNIRLTPVLTAGLIIFLILGGSIYYLTNILNEYTPDEKKIQEQIAYERQYGKYENAEQPHLIASNLQVELYPKERKALIEGHNLYRNDTGHSIDTIHLSIMEDVLTSKMKFDQQFSLVNQDHELGYYMFLLTKPLQQGDTLGFNFTIEFEPKAFSNDGFNTEVMANGTWITSWSWLPEIGYQRNRELFDQAKRKKYGLAPNYYFGRHSDKNLIMRREANEKVDFEIIMSTDTGQIAIAPGSLVNSWTDKGRVIFHYTPEAPIKNSYHMYSADYRINHSKWHDVDISIYLHPSTMQNAETIEKASKRSLEYFTDNFGPYPYRQLKLVQTPDPGTGGTSLPGTIGFSTNFILLDTREGQMEFNLVYAAVSHEIAHQWWGQQLIPAPIEGAFLLTEGLAWYSAFGVVEKEYGRQHLHSLLEAMRKAYLNPRSKADRPLLKATDAFHGYRKGPLAMYALREYIGREEVNKALKKLLDTFRSGEPPYATAPDFYKEIKKVTPDSLQYLLSDLFEYNTYWSLSMRKSTMKKTIQGKWLVSMEVFAKKVRVDTAGIETSIKMNDYIEIGLFKNSGNVKEQIYQEMAIIKSGINALQIEVEERPDMAGIDPRHLLIDAETEDNVLQINGI